MPEVLKSATFEAWFANLRDRQAQARITASIRRLSLGNAGDVKAVGSGVNEMRFDYGPGYRIYFAQRAKAWPYCCAVVINGRSKRILIWPSELPSPGKGDI